MKTSELAGAALDWAVAKCEDGTDFLHDGISMHFELHGLTKVLAKGWAPSMSYCPSTDWSHGGPIIERENITWDGQAAAICRHVNGKYPKWSEYGPTPLIAAMRAYVASVLGDEVEIQKELS